MVNAIRLMRAWLLRVAPVQTGVLNIEAKPARDNRGKWEEVEPGHGQCWEAEGGLLYAAVGVKQARGDDARPRVRLEERKERLQTARLRNSVGVQHQQVPPPRRLEAEVVGP